MRTVRCFYVCDTCGLTRVYVDVPERQEGQGVVEWVAVVAAGVMADDHRARSPRCDARKFTRVAIPMPEEGDERGIGFAPRN